ncbi:MAG: hypothetical protein WAU68_16480 [Vitreimonas sp.]
MYQPDIGKDGRAIAPPGRWEPAEATARINECAGRDDLDLWPVLWVLAWLEQQPIIMGDLLHLLSTGYVYDEAVETSMAGLYFKYTVEGPTPNSNGRTLTAVVVPNGGRKIKVCSVEWKDQK